MALGHTINNEKWGHLSRTFLDFHSGGATGPNLGMSSVIYKSRIEASRKLFTILEYFGGLNMDRVDHGVLGTPHGRTAASVTPDFYGFAGMDESRTKDNVEKLLKDHRYIFPVDPQTSKKLDPDVVASRQQETMFRPGDPPAGSAAPSRKIPTLRIRSIFGEARLSAFVSSHYASHI
ncbi:hypothetical protein B0H17DRAFT_1142206 [Mycena rosella]|uniref:Uncharacterized protein n=1 Tax=Mycena rosella TaxID=1033263 RepID=A0AAD7G5U9_MYCRO|nr:hypothetical protein B0H17DRAFT_1142206 [Mycena rosella]